MSTLTIRLPDDTAERLKTTSAPWPPRVMFAKHGAFWVGEVTLGSEIEIKTDAMRARPPT